MLPQFWADRLRGTTPGSLPHFGVGSDQEALKCGGASPHSPSPPKASPELSGRTASSGIHFHCDWLLDLQKPVELNTSRRIDLPHVSQLGS